MEMNGEQMIAAPRETVWAALNDPDVLCRSIDGCESLERTGENGFVARVIARIGPVKAAFGGNITLTDIDPPNGYTLIGEGSGAGAGFAKGRAQVTLTDVAGSTRLSYAVRADVGGKLAQIGARLIDSTARKQADSFFARFAAIVGESGRTTPGASMTPRMPVSAPADGSTPLRARGPDWISAGIMIVMALVIGFLAGRLWG